MIEVVKYKLTKQQLVGMPTPDRDLLILSGHALNGLNGWMKLLRFSSNNASDGSVESIGTTYHTNLITRSLYAHEVETSNWLDLGETKAAIEAYLDVLEPEAKTAYGEIRTLLDTPLLGGNGMQRALSPLLAKLRNQFSAHFPKKNPLQAAFDYSEADQDWSLYISDEHSNSCYWLSELVVGFGSLSVTGITPSQDAHERVIDEVLRIANTLNDFLVGLMSAVLLRHLGRPPMTAMPVEGAPNGSQFRLPFYTEGL